MPAEPADQKCLFFIISFQLCRSLLVSVGASKKAQSCLSLRVLSVRMFPTTAACELSTPGHQKTTGSCHFMTVLACKRDSCHRRMHFCFRQRPPHPSLFRAHLSTIKEQKQLTKHRISSIHIAPAHTSLFTTFSLTSLLRAYLPQVSISRTFDFQLFKMSRSMFSICATHEVGKCQKYRYAQIHVLLFFFLYSHISNACKS